MATRTRMELAWWLSGGANAQHCAALSFAERHQCSLAEARRRLTQIVELSRAIQAQQQLPYVVPSKEEM